MPMIPQRFLEMRQILATMLRAANDTRLKPATRHRAYALLLATKKCLNTHAKGMKPPRAL